MGITFRFFFVATFVACGTPGEPLPEPAQPPVGGVTFEQPSPTSPQSPYSEVDNPELRTVIDLPNVTFSDTVFQLGDIKVTVVTTEPLTVASLKGATDSVSFAPGDLQVFVTGGSGVAESDGLPVPIDAAAIAANVIPWSNATATISGARADLVGRGLRIGYTPLLVEARNLAPDGTKGAVLSTAAIQLDPQVLLVPVQVLAVKSPNVPNTAGLASVNGALAVFDQAQVYSTTRVTEDQALPLPPLTLITQRSFDTWMDPVTVSPTWLSGPFDGYRDIAFSRYNTPDSIWRDCGVQFRLVEAGSLETSNDALNKLSTSGDITAACDQLIDIAQLNGLLTLPTVIAMANVVPVDSLGAPCSTCPLGTTPRQGGDSPVSCVGSQAYGAASPSPGSTVLAHELGHWSPNLQDCTAGVNGCEFMDSFNRVVPPTPSECASLRTWAQRWATHWR